MQSVYQVPPGGVATVNAARLLMPSGSPRTLTVNGMGACGNCRRVRAPLGACPNNCPHLRGYSRVNPIYRMRGLGDLTVDPTLLLVGIGVLFVGAFMFGGKATPALRKRKVSRLKARRDKYSKRIAELEA